MQPAIVKTETGHVLGTHSWVDGFKPVMCPSRRLCESKAQAHALWLERHVSSEAGLEFIDAWLEGRTVLFQVG